jgi:hypothetical protein
MTGLIGLALVVFGCRSLYRFILNKRSLKRSKVWAESVIRELEMKKGHRVG